jgi:hypothetical protein
VTAVPKGARNHTATLSDGTEIVHYGVQPKDGWYREGYLFRGPERTQLTVDYAAELAAVAVDPGYRPPVFVSTELPGGAVFDQLFFAARNRRNPSRENVGPDD